ncbi:hypothetical protein Poli38472_002032 [Pythium oligandrum]|uniref:Uncharacterized protein n=1 Tax=Pythium oligandrum TaxID=41045 RepID=A0A8K1FHU4_PYTOL|nr:hypothetical protein Poli38472_002032 [Pythium oligandrum]|eukprot:TMW63091.1 hypothetical protein Poli38472_002032 [Pythium oligandrum]
MERASWTSATAATALALVAAIPIVYYKWKQSGVRQERQEALKLLRKVELIIGEVSVRLMHIENQAEDLLANEGRPEQPDQVDSESSLSSYYHFDSQGNKLKTKWDSYDVDAELEKLDDDEQRSSTNKTSTSAAPGQRPAPTISKSKLLTTVAGIENEFEAILEFLDDVRGDEKVKAARKDLVTRITTEHLSRVDAVRVLLA